MSDFTRRSFIGAVAGVAGMSAANLIAQEKSELAREIGKRPDVILFGINPEAAQRDAAQSKSRHRRTCRG